MYKLKRISDRKVGMRVEVDIFLTHNNKVIEKVDTEKIFVKWKLIDRAQSNKCRVQRCDKFPVRLRSLKKGIRKKYKINSIEVSPKSSGINIEIDDESYKVSIPYAIHLSLSDSDGKNLIRKKKLDSIFN